MSRDGSSRGKPSSLSSVRTWLMRQPQPAHVLADGKRIDVPRTPRPWPELFNTLVTLAPDNVTCCATDGTILRACEWPDSEGGDSKGDASPEITDVQLFAKLIAEAYEKSGLTYAPLLDNAMRFIERQGQRLAQMEREIEKLRAFNHKLQGQLLAARVEPQVEAGDEGLLGSLVAGYLQAQAQGVAEPAPPPPAAPNGKQKRS